jgi:YVTN family beta-propeller protein
MRSGSTWLVLALLAAGCGATDTVEAAVNATTTSTTTSTSTTAPATTTTSSTTTSTTTTTTTLVPEDGLTAAERVLAEVAVIGGDIAPKSIVASGDGLYAAQNMMYRHTVTVYDRDFELVATIPDSVVLSEFGHEGFEGEYRGAPVEAAFTSTAEHLYVSNYEMYGAGVRSGAGDSCRPGQWPDSFVYRIDTGSLEIDQVIAVGSVPKYLAVTPDDRLLVVSNWCSYDLSIVDLEQGVEIARVDVGRYPRGIAITPDSSTAHVAVMGSTRVTQVDLETLEVAGEIAVGTSPRHLVLSPDGALLYVSLNGEGRLAKVDLTTGDVLARVATGDAPRSMAISDDGTALYVVNYRSGTVSKVRTSDMSVVQEVRAGYHPIGITYDPSTRQVWVANYGGTIQVFEDVSG